MYAWWLAIRMQILHLIVISSKSVPMFLGMMRAHRDENMDPKAYGHRPRPVLHPAAPHYFIKYRGTHQARSLYIILLAGRHGVLLVMMRSVVLPWRAGRGGPGAHSYLPVWAVRLSVDSFRLPLVCPRVCRPPMHTCMLAVCMYICIPRPHDRLRAETRAWARGAARRRVRASTCHVYHPLYVRW